jgi:cytochrome c peroxidase
MTLINSRFYENGRFFWDERAATLEEQVLMPIVDCIEMGMTLNELETKLSGLYYYEVLFQNAYGSSEVTFDKIAKALSQFIHIVGLNSGVRAKELVLLIKVLKISMLIINGGSLGILNSTSVN